MLILVLILTFNLDIVDLCTPGFLLILLLVELRCKVCSVNISLVLHDHIYFVTKIYINIL